MNINPINSSDTVHIVKSESGRDNNSRYKSNYLRDLIKQKKEYEQEIARLKKAHNEQISKLCTELEKSSSLSYQYKLELDSMRTSINIKEKQMKNKNNESSSIQDLKRKNVELSAENTKLKTELSILTTKYQKLSNDMQDAQQYVLKMIARLD
ncbi:unnamed protein product [Rotaria sp. Silwood2]|nr:unnamed protein product [Rotaria sp. Silwood2]CAF3277373.1 unnamed protein product [Rotaria sp. Silwood2]